MFQLCPAPASVAPGGPFKRGRSDASEFLSSVARIMDKVIFHVYLVGLMDANLIRMILDNLLPARFDFGRCWKLGKAQLRRILHGLSGDNHCTHIFICPKAAAHRLIINCTTRKNKGKWWAAHILREIPVLVLSGKRFGVVRDCNPTRRGIAFR
jgi:hypothetical protein